MDSYRFVQIISCLVTSEARVVELNYKGDKIKFCSPDGNTLTIHCSTCSPGELTATVLEGVECDPQDAAHFDAEFSSFRLRHGL